LLWIALIPTVGSAFYHLRIKGWRVSGVMLTASNLAPKETDLVQREIQEISEALEAFKAAVEAGETTGFQDGAIRSHGGT
jgi:hypothetical protein